MVNSIGKSDQQMRTLEEGMSRSIPSPEQEKNSKDAATAAQYGDVFQQIQAKYGAKPEKQREIKKTLGKDDFLRIMLTQMKNQDPTSPFKAEQMATEIAQFTSVEQLQNMNQNLNKLSTQNKPIEQMMMTGMIGKTITVDKERFPHTEGENDSLSFYLPADAKKTDVVVYDDSGEEIYRKDMGSQKSGSVNFIWDGKKSNTLPAKSGTYSMKIEAIDEREQKIQVSSLVQSRVIGVSFEGQEPILLIGDAHHQEKVTMRNIVKVQMDGPQKEAGSGIQPVTAGTDQAPHYFGFKKGVGSVPVSSDALESLQRESQEKGFPNGLSESMNNDPRKEVSAHE